MARRITRRSYLKSTAAATALTILPAGLARGYAANEKVNVGIIGTGGMGGGNRHWLRDDGANIVALCDVDRNSLAAAAKDHKGAKSWTDFRQMLQEQKEVDAVMVSTPDHTHAVASMMAMKLGKHVCTEKPLTHSVYEARALGEAAKRFKVATQMDNEGHATEGVRSLVEWIRTAAVGKVREVHIWTDRPIWPQAIAQRPASKPVPAHLDWDLWLGPAPYRDYHDLLHPFKWRGWWDFGTGALGDMGCHFFDGAYWALKLGHPTTVEAVSEGNNKETGPSWSIVTYQFPARGDDFPPVTLKWYDGRKLPPRPAELAQGRKLPSNGSMFVGETGTIVVEGTGNARLIPEEKMKAYKRPEPFIPRSPGHKLEWLQACQGGKPASSNFTDYGGPMTEVVLLGNVALRAGKKIQWDAENLCAKNAPDVDQYIRREYRKGWEL
jgi:predicted dehydrogenase